MPRMSYHHCPSRQGFSLIELLAVMAVFAILTAILIPAISHIRRNAMVVKDADQIRQIGLGIFSYAHDHELRLPGPLYTNQMTHYRAGSFSGHLSSILPEYVDAPPPDDQLRVLSLMVDPVWEEIVADPDVYNATCYRVIQLKPRETSATFIKGQNIFGYAGYTGQDESKRSPLRLSQVPETIPFSGIPIITNKNLAELDDLPSHQDRRNILFLDGHVETFQSEDPEFDEYY
ncbi:MAG: prepilin-type N-terminal cleavage/methylation domain-containing protein [Verrucomicrobiota bacterium JB024]|nr:prepilin-type N-terminal cleavage/methylation domain-containing protein [Verrucomicrobiota bacterium JB024]